MAFTKIQAFEHCLTGEHLFSVAGGNQNIFEIPEYQRPYVWKKEHWEALFTDIINNDDGYFIGAIICAEQPKPANHSMKYTKYDVIDGQQRLTTLSVFLAAIYSVLQNCDENLFNKSQKRLRDNIEIQLLVEDYNSKFLTRVMPQNQDNIDDYLNILISAELVKKAELAHKPIKGKFDGRHLIPRAYKYFKKTVAKYAEGNKSQSNDDLSGQINRIMEILSKVNAAQLVIIKADSPSSANALFEALNNRGEPLTITDLIKNRLFAGLKEKYSSDFETYKKEWDVNIWKKIFIEDGKEISCGEQERFFRHSYNAFRTAWIKDYPDESLTIGKRANLYEFYEKMIHLDSLRVFEQISECAKIYFRLQGKELDNTKLNKAYKDLSRINGATSYTLLLYLVKNRKSLQIDDDKKFEDICNLLIKFFVRRSFTDDPPANRLDAIFIGYIDEIEKNHYVGDTVCNKLADWLKNEYKADTDDEKFKTQLREDVYDPKGTNSAIRFVLIKLAESHLKKNAPDFWEKITSGKNKKEFYKWSIEHILPRTLTTDWEKMLGDADPQEYVNKLGNLTLTAYNTELSNRPFKDKKEDYFKSPLNSGLNSYICNQTVWSAEHIQERTNLLAEEISNLLKW